MIETLSIRNFKVLREVDLHLRPLTLIVGPNASGKSTILEVLRHFWDYISEGIAVLPSSTEGNILLSRSPRGEIKLKGSGKFAGKHLKVELGPSGKLKTWEADGNWEGLDFHEGLGKRGQLQALQTLRSELEPAQALSLDVERLAAPSYLKEIRTVLPNDGEGLSAYLASLSVEYPVHFQGIVRKLRAIVPVVENIRLRPAYVIDDLGRHVGYELLFDMRGAEGIPASSVSEGTLLTLGLLTVLSSAEPPQLVLIDDLERGLHPKALGDLIQQFRLLQEQNPELQIVATSHSPYLLDYLKAEEVLLTSLDQDGYAAVKSLTEHPEYERWKDLMAPGEFWSTVGESWITEPVAK
jgi:predicted ATPase